MQINTNYERGPVTDGLAVKKAKYERILARGHSKCLALWKRKAISYVTFTYLGWGWCSVTKKVISLASI